MMISQMLKHFEQESQVIKGWHESFIYGIVFNVDLM